MKLKHEIIKQRKHARVMQHLRQSSMVVYAAPLLRLLDFTDATVAALNGLIAVILAEALDGSDWLGREMKEAEAVLDKLEEEI